MPFTVDKTQELSLSYTIPSKVFRGANGPNPFIGIVEWDKELFWVYPPKL
jgi:hypothetical protein